MPRRYSVGLALVLALTLAAVPSYATSWIHLTGDPPPMPSSPTICLVGNNSPIDVAGPLMAVGDETTLRVDPLTQCTACPFGLDVFSVNATLWVDAECDVTLRAKFRSEDAAAYGSGCPVPGKLECTGPDMVYTLNPGFNTINVPNTSSCACADVNYAYFIGFELVATDCGEVRRTANDSGGPGPVCTSYHLPAGGGIVDEASLGIPGQLGLNAYAGCCEKPVGTEPKSIGGVKSGFEDEE